MSTITAANEVSSFVVATRWGIKKRREAASGTGKSVTACANTVIVSGVVADSRALPANGTGRLGDR
jgi:hypothetical protein